jgi:hypothetical protein
MPWDISISNTFQILIINMTNIDAVHTTLLLFQLCIEVEYLHL